MYPCQVQMCTEESDWDDGVKTYQPMPQTQITPSWFKSQMMPQGEPAPNSSKSKRTLTSSEQMESDWDEDLYMVPDYPVRAYNDRRKPQPIRRQNFVIRSPPQGWPKDHNNGALHTPVHTSEYKLIITPTNQTQ